MSLFALVFDLYGLYLGAVLIGGLLVWLVVRVIGGKTSDRR